MKERVSRKVLGKYTRKQNQAFREVVYIKKPSEDGFLLFKLRVFNQIQSDIE